MRLSFDSLRNRLFALFALVIVVPCLFGVFAAYSNYKELLSRVRMNNYHLAVLASNFEAGVFLQTQHLADSLAHEATILSVGRDANDAARDACNRMLMAAIKPYPVYGSAALYGVDGKVRCETSQDPSFQDVSARAWFRKLLVLRTSEVGDAEYSTLLAEPVISFAMPLLVQGKDIAGVLSLRIRLNWLNAVGHDRGLPAGSGFKILDSQGNILIAGSRSTTAPDAELPADLPELLKQAPEAVSAKGQDGLQRLYSVHALAEGGPYGLFSRPYDSMVGPLRRNMLVQIAILALVSLTGMMAALTGARLLVTRWTEQLARFARHISSGKEARYPDLTGAPREFQELGEALARMNERIKGREHDLKVSLAQKQIMLREIHHRVKNNLQIVTSLLNIYARLQKSEPIKQSLADIQVRINTLALVHRHLYESQDLQEINLAPFMTNLCNLLYDGCGISGRRIRLLVDISPISIAGERAVPLALFTTEILTNAFKHAFPEQRRGTIRVKLQVAPDGAAVLIIADDGIGYPHSSEPQQFSMGQYLVSSLTKQLGGTLNYSNGSGTVVTLHFNIHGNAADKSDLEPDATATIEEPDTALPVNQL
ncbi:MAG TPA: sensor histidine kinase [Dongiaceae bacterium]|jgi:two-component sensor histidine kinase|nr:sensor histidine kinase [Dongiaceae bacterium]